jgi:hypothetical protein
MMLRAYLRRAFLAIGAACVFTSAPAGAATLTERLTVANARIEVELDAELTRAQPDLMKWVANSADTVARFYGQFPVSVSREALNRRAAESVNSDVALKLRLRSRPGSGVQGGVTTNTDGARISVRVGTDVTPRELAEDWVLVHEMIHLAFPEVGRRRSWLSEGLATYVEGIARAQAGRRAVKDVWAEYKHSMPVGVPKAGEGGLDQTHTWARTYWGGALFCLTADVSIRQQSKNQYGLREGLAAVLKATGGYAGPAGEEGLPIEQVLRIADEATHTSVLSDLYREWKDTPVRPDLPAFWKQLGVRGQGNGIEFDDGAPLARVRVAMTKP